MQQGMDTSPVQHWTQGLARVAQTAIGGWQAGKAERDEKKARAATNQKIAAALMPGAEPDLGAFTELGSDPWAADNPIVAALLQERISKRSP